MPKECCKETWEKIPDDEPVFIIRGKDLLACGAVSDWITRAELEAVVPDEKIAKAKEHLLSIITFQEEHPERCKMPD